MSGDPATVLRADTHLSVKADLGGLAIGLSTLSKTGGAFGRATSNWNDRDDENDDHDSNITAISMLPGAALDNTAQVTIQNARLEVDDLNGLLQVDAVVAGVDATARVKARSNSLGENNASAVINGDMDARIELKDQTWLRASTVALAAYEILQKWTADAEIRKNGGGQANASVTNTGDVGVSATSGAHVLANTLNVDARQFERRNALEVWEPDPPRAVAVVWEPDPEGATQFVSHSSSLKKTDKTGNLSAITSVTLNDDSNFTPIDWNAQVFGLAQARLVLKADGTVDESHGKLNWSQTADTVTIQGVQSYESQSQVNFGWTTVQPTAKAHLQPQELTDKVCVSIAVPAAQSVTPTLHPSVLVINQWDGHLAVNSLDLSPATGSATVTVNNNGSSSSPNAAIDGKFSRLVIDNQATGRDVQLNGNLTATQIELESKRDLTTATAVTLTGDRFALEAGRTVGPGVTTPPSTPPITLQAQHPAAVVDALAGQDLSLQVQFAPDSTGTVTPVQQFAAQQLDVRLLPWKANSLEQTTNYQVQLEVLPSTIPNRIVSLTGNRQPTADWNGATALSTTSVGLDVWAHLSTQPNVPRLLVEATGAVNVDVVSSGALPTSVSRVTSSFGDVTLSSPGDLTIGQLVSSPKTVTWAGAGALRSAQPGTPVIQANQLHLGGPGGLG
ncbi:MAG: hypothetical protein ACK6D3_18055, partial [Planctomycetaceae bacterium]